VKRNGDAELPFDIALALQGRESKILAVGQIEQRSGGRYAFYSANGDRPLLDTAGSGTRD
jgi:hypothetical protein